MKNMLVPMVVEKAGNSERAYDIYSCPLKDRRCLEQSPRDFDIILSSKRVEDVND